MSARRESSEARDLLLAAVERRQPRFGLVDLGLDGADIGGGVDQLLIELGAVLAERGDLGLELGLQLPRRSSAARARGLQLLLALLDGVGRDGRGLWRRRSPSELCARLAASGDRRPSCANGDSCGLISSS